MSEGMMILLMLIGCLSLGAIMAYLDEKYPIAFNLTLCFIMLTILLYVCIKKYNEASARLEKSQQTQEAKP
jgi:formate hydrogenlyase subunit 4